MRPPECWSVLFVLVLSVTASADEDAQKKDDPFAGRRLGPDRLGENRREIAGLLTETAAEKLSEAQVVEVLRIQRSFENTDLAVIDWDAASGVPTVIG